MLTRMILTGAAAAVCVALSAASPAGADRLAQSDLDAFMAKVLARRDENWKKLQQYILDERERIDVRGPTGQPIWGQLHDYSWFIRDGYFIRSPVRANGVEIGEAERKKAEDEFFRRVKARDERAKREAADKAATSAPDPGTDGPPPAAGEPPTIDAFLQQTRRPQFVDSAYFLNFKFEQGKYALVGREAFDSLEVLRVEYYPTRLFTHEQDDERRRREQKRPNRNEDREAAIERMMNKVALVTLWIEPKSHQIVKYTFDNVNFDFLPAAWLLRVTDLKATMTMSQPFPDVWLPRDVDFYFSAMLAVGDFSVRYRLDYRDYKQATTSGRIIRIGGGK